MPAPGSESTTQVQKQSASLEQMGTVNGTPPHRLLTHETPPEHASSTTSPSSVLQPPTHGGAGVGGSVGGPVVGAGVGGAHTCTSGIDVPLMAAHAHSNSHSQSSPSSSVVGQRIGDDVTEGLVSRPRRHSPCHATPSREQFWSTVVLAVQRAPACAHGDVAVHAGASREPTSTSAAHDCVGVPDASVDDTSTTFATSDCAPSTSATFTTKKGVSVAGGVDGRKHSTNLSETTEQLNPTAVSEVMGRNTDDCSKPKSTRYVVVPHDASRASLRVSRNGAMTSPSMSDSSASTHVSVKSVPPTFTPSHRHAGESVGAGVGGAGGVGVGGGVGMTQFETAAAPSEHAQSHRHGAPSAAVHESAEHRRGAPSGLVSHTPVAAHSPSKIGDEPPQS